MKQPTSITTLITEINTQLQTVYPDPILCEQYSWWIIEAVTGNNKARLLTEHKLMLTEHQKTKLDSWLNKLVNNHMPIQYLIGSVPFNNCEILVEPPILIPRPETEEWCYNLITELKKQRFNELTILDLCSGSGCIAVALAKALPTADIYAVDINPHAIALGNKNAVHNGCTNVTFIESDLFTNIPAALRFDLIVANPPYIDPAARKSIDSSVTAWEDPNALFAENHGLALIETIIKQAPHWLTCNKELHATQIPQLMIEIDATQGEAVTRLMQKNGYRDSVVRKDLEGKDRVVQARVSCGHFPP